MHRQYGQLPLGYDHKYVYSHFGYNLKATDMQAAIGCAQLEKFPVCLFQLRHINIVLRDGHIHKHRNRPILNHRRHGRGEDGENHV